MSDRSLRPLHKIVNAADAIDGKRTKFSIEGSNGLSLDCHPGGPRDWFVRYQVGRGREGRVRRFVRIGSFDHGEPDYLTLADAQEKASKIARDAKRDGVDFLADQRAVKAVEKADAEANALTFAVCFDLWMGHTGKRRKRTLSDRSEAEYRRIYRIHIEPSLGAKPVAAITKADVERCLETARENTSDASKGQRGTQALKALKIIRPVCELALDREWIDRNPCRGIDDPVPRDNPDGKQSRAPTNDELRQLWCEMANEMPPAVVSVLALTILLGRRISEIAGAQREEALLDQTPPVLMIPADREGNKSKRLDAVPLPPLALSIVSDAMGKGDGRGALFVGATNRKTTSECVTEFRRAREWPGQVRLHDMRTLVNDAMASMRIPAEMRSRTLGHSGDLRALVNSTYSSFDYQDERYRALRMWEIRLKDILRAPRRLHVLRWR